MAKKRTAKYWKNRAVYLKKRLINRSVEEYEWMAEQYEKAAKNIQREIEYWYARFAENNEISLADAKKLLTSRELKELKWDVEEYIEKGRTLNYSDQWAKELENASARAHINRYEALQLQMQQQTEALYGGQLDAMDKALREMYQDGYYRAAYDVQKGFRVGWNLAALDERRIEKALARPWGVDGKNFSDRIWENKNKLIGTLNKALTQSIIRGEAPDKAIKEISRVMEVDRKKAGRLVMTESAFIASESQKDCYKELGVEYFEVLATLDSHTCSDCGVREGQKIPMSEYESGVTAPPFHPYCRCCTVPAFDDEFDIGKRAARGADDKTYYVPGDMSYEEWRERFVHNAVESSTEPDKIENKEREEILTPEQVIEKAKEFAEDSQYKVNMPLQETRAITNAKLGYDGLPNVVSESEFERLSAEKTVLYRGLKPNGDKSAMEIAEEFKYGEFWTGDSGGTIYGNGVYFAKAEAEAKKYTAKNGEIITAFLKDNARVADYREIAAEYWEARNKMKRDTIVFSILNDCGQYAAIKGYDAISIDKVFGNRHDYILVLNRGKCVVKE